MKQEKKYISMFLSCLYNIQDNNLLDIFKKESLILTCNVDLIFFDWDDHLEAKEVYNRLMQNDKIQEFQETSGYYAIQYDDDPNIVTIMPKLLNDNYYKDIIIDNVKTADSIKFWSIIVDKVLVNTPNYLPIYYKLLKEYGYEPLKIEKRFQE